MSNDLSRGPLNDPNDSADANERGGQDWGEGQEIPPGIIRCDATGRTNLPPCGKKQRRDG